MGAVTGRCPPPDVLERLLAEQLDGPERDSVEGHVEGCSTCQEWLDHRTLSPPAVSAGAAAARGAVTPQPDAAFLEKMGRLAQPAAAPPRVEDWLESGRLGQYEILAKLGQGGMGAVYKARHVELGKTVALKVLPADRIHEASIARFKREVRAVGQLEHPNIVAAYDAGQQRGIHYLVMSLVEGVDLARLVDGRGPLKVADACEVARQAAAGLQHAADHGLVHRDVKPSNLMLARDGLVKLLDLGLALSSADAAAEKLTAAGSLLGTADYLAPEQWERPHAADARADIYSLGCTLYHFLAGQPPFAGESYETVIAKMVAHQQVPPPPLDRVRPDVPAGLAAVLGRMLAKEPADRFASSAEVAVALGPFAAGADLPRLLRPGDGGGPPPPPAAGTKGPELCETRPDPRGKVASRPPRASSRSAAFALVALGLVLFATSLLLWFGRGGRPEPATGQVKIEKLRVDCFREKGKTSVGELPTSPVAVRLNDDVRVGVKLSAPAYCYLIAFNPDGKAQLLYPTGGDSEGASAARPERRAAVEYPAEDAVFVLDATGMQVIVLAASAKPLPPFAEWKAAAGAIPWKSVPDGGSWHWLFDGREYKRYPPPERGHVEPKLDVPPTLYGLCEFFKRRTEFDSVQVIAFPVGKETK
jgi:serine/threonine protein kinase